jgi:predicted DNA-binding antitoxin AbrB/MazE fold protein
MTTAAAAVYENGAVHLIEPLELAEGERVQVVKTSVDSLTQLGPGPDPQRAAQILAEIAALAMEPDGEQFSGEDHDRILYGEKGAR